MNKMNTDYFKNHIFEHWKFAFKSEYIAYHCGSVFLCSLFTFRIEKVLDHSFYQCGLKFSLIVRILVLFSFLLMFTIYVMFQEDDVVEMTDGFDAIRSCDAIMDTDTLQLKEKTENFERLSVIKFQLKNIVNVVLKSNASISSTKMVHIPKRMTAITLKMTKTITTAIKRSTIAIYTKIMQNRVTIINLVQRKLKNKLLGFSHYVTGRSTDIITLNDGFGARIKSVMTMIN